MKELLLVLVDNAIQYTPDGGEIRLSVAAARTDEVVISVVDNGVGIAAHDLPHLFERFYRADDSRHRDSGTASGTGLGLSIAQWIADEHGGRIEVQSEPGRGSTFTLRLPVHTPTAPADTRRPWPPPGSLPPLPMGAAVGVRDSRPGPLYFTPRRPPDGRPLVWSGASCLDWCRSASGCCRRRPFLPARVGQPRRADAGTPEACPG